MIIESSCRFAVRPWPGLVLAGRSVVRPPERLPLPGQPGWIPGPGSGHRDGRQLDGHGPTVQLPFKFQLVVSVP